MPWSEPKIQVLTRTLEPEIEDHLTAARSFEDSGSASGQQMPDVGRCNCIYLKLSRQVQPCWVRHILSQVLVAVFQITSGETLRMRKIALRKIT